MTPLIGLTTSRITSISGLQTMGVTEAYVNALVRAGAVPMLIPLNLPTETYAAIVARLDGILFTGGGDVHPSAYQHVMHPLVSDVDTDRDRMELELIRLVAQSDVPFLGICRGLQVINIALGGTLYEDLVDQRPNTIRHKYYPDIPRDHLAHAVEVETNSRLHDILQTSVAQVNSLHHQGIQELGAGLQATAYAPDGVIEAFELPGHSFGMAVQWHPEWLNADQGMQRLFQEFVRTAEHTLARQPAG